MAKRPTRSGAAWTGVGLGLAATHLALLTGVALFDDGRLVSDWMGTSVWLLIVAMPAILAAIGLRNPSALVGAAVISLPIALISLAGATLPVIFPALCYLAGYIASERDPEPS